MKTKYVHTNIVAKDWRKLSEFYTNALDCQPVFPERNLKGSWIDEVTDIDNVQIEGIHLQLPGYENGPTLEIFGYNKTSDPPPGSKINRPGFAHIAFHVDDVDVSISRFVKYGGEFYGSKVEKRFKDLGLLTVVYMKDPEGNIVELQNWKQ